MSICVSKVIHIKLMTSLFLLITSQRPNSLWYGLSGLVRKHVTVFKFIIFHAYDDVQHSLNFPAR